MRKIADATIPRKKVLKLKIFQKTPEKNYKPENSAKKILSPKIRRRKNSST